MKNNAHRKAISLLKEAFSDYISQHNGDCKIFTETVALYTNEFCDDEEQFCLPDFMVVCNPDRIRSNGIHKPPKFVAEITAPESEKNDYVYKLYNYFHMGVEEYWIVNLQRKNIVTYLLSEDYFPNIHYGSYRIKVNTYPGLEIDYSDVMNETKTSLVEEELLKELDKGIDDIENGRVLPHQEAMTILRQRYYEYVTNQERNKDYNRE